MSSRATGSRAAEIAERVASVRGRIETASARAGRSADSVLLVAVSKTRPLEDLLLAVAAGVTAFGENRVQEAAGKFPSLPPRVARHLIGPLQSNKANRAAEIADVVQTVDSEDVARRLARAALRTKKRLAVFVQVNTGAEATKAGVSPEEVPGLVATVRALEPLDLKGLMAIPPPGDTRPHFARLRALARAEGLPELSMGMSEDFEAAVEEGATLVRVGSAIFGARG